MLGHSVGLMDFAQGAKAVDVLGVARVLATSSVRGDEGATFDARTQSLQLTTVSVRLGRAGFVRKPTPIAVARVPFATPARTPAMEVGTIEGSSPVVHRRGMSRRTGIGSPTPSVAISRIPSPEDRAHATSEQDQMVEAAFTHGGQRPGLDDLLARLTGELERRRDRAAGDRPGRGGWLARRPGSAPRSSTAMRSAERARRRGRRRFSDQPAGLFKPGMLRGLAQLLARRRDLRPAIETVFVRSGDVGADVLVDLLVASNLASERRAYGAHWRSARRRRSP